MSSKRSAGNRLLTVSPLSNILFVNEKNSLSVSRVIFADVNLFCLTTPTQNFDEGKGSEQI